MANALQALLQVARGLFRRNAESCAPRDISVEVSFAKCIFEPGFSLVHGDFALAQASVKGLWPANIRPNGKVLYGIVSLDGDEVRLFQCIDEDGFLLGVVKDCILAGKLSRCRTSRFLHFSALCAHRLFCTLPSCQPDAELRLE